jgi:guanylate kinase
LSGPGGVGKGTIARRLVEFDSRLWLSRSWTTRRPRPGEDETAYTFVDRPTFEAHRASGGFLEHAEFLGNLYGTPVPLPPSGFDVLLEIDVQGARQVRARDIDALLIFVTAPSPGEQAARLRSRGDSDDHVRERLEEAQRENAAAEELGAITVVNDELDRAVDEILSLINRARADQRRA